MLNKLIINNYALIDEVEINFTGGLTIITGETGAGKSILLGALSLLLGSRADSNSLYIKSKKCIIEGEFDINGYKLEDFFKSNDLDFDKKTIIRRELSSDGKSRAFINDTPVNLTLLKSIGHRLIEIHSQHETLTLNDSSFQMTVIDSIGGTGALLEDYKLKYNEYIDLVKKLQLLKEEQSKSTADIDYFTFQFNEIENASLKSGEQEQLEADLEVINNSTDIKKAFNNASILVDSESQSLLPGLNSLYAELNGISKVFPQVNDLVTRIKSIVIEIKDISTEIEQLEREVTFDPAQEEIISDRLDLIYSLQKKHRVNSIDELIKIYNDLDVKIGAIGSLDESIEKLESNLSKLKTTLLNKAGEIRKLRMKAIPGIEKTVKELLTELGMKHSVLKIDLNPLPENEFKNNGIDLVQFLFSANKGIEYKELNKVASGGELSRLMLSIKSLIAKYTELPTIIFDEIDTGISGEIAHKAGNLVKTISQERQVIAITHLPQMAGKGNTQLLVYKDSEGDISKTKIRKLTSKERVEEIAKMLSGDQPSKSALSNAKELLQD